MQAWLIVNSYTLFLTILIIAFSKRQKSSPTMKTKIFKEMISALFLLVIIDSFGHIEPVNEVTLRIRKIATCLAFTFDPMYHIIALFYVDYWMDEKLKSQRNRIPIYIMALVATFMATLIPISVIFDLKWFYYYIGNVYCRGPFFDLRATYLMLSALFVGFYTIYYRNHIGKQYQSAMMVFPFIPVLFGVLQPFILGISFEYVGMLFSILILFINVQNRDMNRDGLTGLYNRRKFDIEFNERVKNATELKTFSLIMIDLDYFKEINDTYGHQVGDDVLEIMGEILRKCFDKNDIITRYGGDEFAIISNIQAQTDLDDRIKNLKRKIKSYNKRSNKEYKLSASIGGAIYKPFDGRSCEDFMAFVDRLMYIEKEKRHLDR